jgi:hypothetical protein
METEHIVALAWYGVSFVAGSAYFIYRLIQPSADSKASREKVHIAGCALMALQPLLTALFRQGAERLALIVAAACIVAVGAYQLRVRRRE